MPVAIVTDSTSYMPRELAEREGIKVVSLYVTFDGSQVRETDLPNFDSFYDTMRTAPVLPTTSQPAPGDFLEVYEPLLESGHDIVSIHLSGRVSGTAQAAQTAADQALETYGQRRIEVVDTHSIAAGTGLISLAAAAAARGGGDVLQVAERARNTAFEFWFAVDTLEYFQRGGRIGRAQAWIGTALKVKPILTFQEGEVAPVERVRTTRRAYERMVELLGKFQSEGLTAWVVQHSQIPDVADRLVEAGREIMGCDPVFVSELGPVLGTYGGPAMLGTGAIDPAMLSERP